jgi:protocatechuate 3,4-dioxygenase, alpha subunit
MSAPSHPAAPGRVPSPRLPTPSQTAGPFVSLGTGWLAEVATLSDAGPSAIVVAGSVVDGEEHPVTDAMLEFWQTDGADGSLARAFTGPDGRYRLVTLKPAPLAGPPGQLQAPHIDVSIFARGLMQRLVTRIYFSDEEANQADPLLSALESQDLRSRLVAQRLNIEQRGSSGGPPSYRFDIHLQGDRETVFFGPW